MITHNIVHEYKTSNENFIDSLHYYFVESLRIAYDNLCNSAILDAVQNIADVHTICNVNIKLYTN
jgi:hypothetical protein